MSTVITGGGEPLWDKLFMRDSTVQLRLTAADGRNYSRVLATNSQTKRFEAVAQPLETGEYEAIIELSSPYGAVSTNVGKIQISGTAASLPEQVEVEYPELPNLVPARWFASTRIMVPAVLPIGTARVRFQPVNAVSLSAYELNVDNAHPAALHLTVRDPVHTSSPIPVPYETLWTDGQQEQRRVGVMVVVARPIPLLAYLGQRKLKLGELVCGLLLTVWIYRRFIAKPAMRGVLLVTVPGETNAQRFEVYGKMVSVYESREGETSSSERIRIVTGQNRLLFTMKLVHQNGQWKPEVEPGRMVSVSGPLGLRIETPLS